MTSSGRRWWLVGILVCVVGPTGCGRIWDLGPMAWLRPDFVPPSPFLVNEVANTSQILVEPHLIDAEFRKAWIWASDGCG